MSLLEFFLKRETAGLVKNRVRLRTIGRTQDLPEVVRKQLDHAIAATAQFTEQTLVLALNYGARTEVLDAARAYAADLAAGKTQPAGDDWSAFSRYLYTAGIPDPDLVIRTSGETRISNFLLMQAAYAEFVFTPTLWPDFTKADLEAAIADYHRRERRFGLTSEQVSTPSA